MRKAASKPHIPYLRSPESNVNWQFGRGTLRKLRQIAAVDPSPRVLIDLEDWMQVPGILPVLHKAIPTGAFSGALHNWNSEMLAEARRLGVATFVNVLGSEDTAANLKRAASMGFDFIQTDHQLDLKQILARP